MRMLVMIIAAALATSSATAQQNLCPCVPVSHLWIVKTCADWNCAATELAVANGDPQVIALPVGMNDARWVVVRRLASGVAASDGTDPFQLEQFDGMPSAAVRFAAIATDHHPLLLTAPDGQVLVLALREPDQRKRAVAHH